MAKSQPKLDLIREMDRARASMACSAAGLREGLDVGKRVSESFHEHKGACVGGAAILGLLLAKLPARKKKIYLERKGAPAIKEVEKAGIVFVVLRFLFNAFRPMLMSLLSKQLTEMVKTRSQHGRVSG